MVLHFQIPALPDQKKSGRAGIWEWVMIYHPGKLNLLFLDLGLSMQVPNATGPLQRIDPI
jgi:prepilin-type processing-associated H-X9-DG protein